VRARGGGGNGGSAGGSAHARAEKGCPFIADAHAVAPHFGAKPSQRFNAWVLRPWHSCAAGRPTASR
jgi:aryl-alcohol dehydrogenase-like predicted oxidoreductase